MPVKNGVLRYKANQPVENIFTNSEIKLGAPLQNTKLISVMVWNIFKQQKANWLSTLNRYATRCHLVLLQEAQATTALVKFATSHYLVADQVPAIKFLKPASGVMTLSSTYPLYCCPLQQIEPILRVAKSTLITVYPLFDSQLLMVINIHAINFSIGTNIYHQQLKAIAEQVLLHTGPTIFAGDFNTWSKQRLYELYQFSQQLGLYEAKFDADNRKKIFGLPLDFIFYKGLKVVETKSIKTNASDHNPMLINFHT